MKNLITDDPILKKARQKYFKSNGDKKLLEVYENRLKILRDDASLLEEAGNKGRQVGIIESNSETVRSIRKNGFSDEEISKLTNISIDFVKSVVD